MRSPIELWYNTKNLPPRERIVDVASFFLGTKYEFGAYDAKPLDGSAGRPLKPIEGASFVRAVFQQVFPESGIRRREDLNALAFQGADLFVDVAEQLEGDIACWEGHVGIIYDTSAGTFIGAQPSTGVVVASYTKGYWATNRRVIKFRRWRTL